MPKQGHNSVKSALRLTKMTSMNVRQTPFGARPRLGYINHHNRWNDRMSRTSGDRTAMAAGVFFAVSMGMISQAFGATCDRNYDASLDKAVAATIGAVAGNNAPAFLAQVSPQGMSFAADGPKVPFATLSSDFSAKTGRYCDLFTCNGKVGALHHLFVPGKADKQIDATHATATVFLNANTNNELGLSYKFNTQCKWELNGIATP